MEKQEKHRRVTAGFYKTYDGNSVYVVGIFKNVSTNSSVVLCRREYGARDYFAINYTDFCSDVEINGKSVPKFHKDPMREKLDPFDINELICQGFPPPVRHTKEFYLDDPFDTFRPICYSYYEYAKELCDGYVNDLRLYNFIKSGKTWLSTVTTDDTQIIVEDIEFVQNAFETVLSEYKSFFTAHCVNKQSIRKYAKEHKLNRGSVEHLKRKMLASLAALLERRDKSENKCRIHIPPEVPKD